jgi:hypothetical protein
MAKHHSIPARIGSNVHRVIILGLGAPLIPQPFQMSAADAFSKKDRPPYRFLLLGHFVHRTYM